ncbi:MAG TPA: hypothetical protein VFH28_07585, partial [Nitrososphaera sp.]|nr:hypothetical protein [Nitrososphaera sp.]
MTRRWQLDEMRRYFVPKVGPIAITLLIIMITLPILQPALATATNSPTTNTTIDDNNNEFNNSVSVLSSNQSGTLLDKTNVT